MAANAAPASSSTTKQFAIGDQVELLGLQTSPHLNHRVGLVMGAVMEDGRYPVVLVEGESINTWTTMAIKPTNIKSNIVKVQTCPGCIIPFLLDRLKVCDRCHMVAYCSRECQVSHWHKLHKDECKLLRQGAKG